MDCHQVESEIQDLLDLRRPLVLSVSSVEHCADCASCQGFLDVFAAVSGSISLFADSGMESCSTDGTLDSTVKAALAGGFSHQLQGFSRNVASDGALIPLAEVAVEVRQAQPLGQSLFRTKSGASIRDFRANVVRVIAFAAAASVLLTIVGLNWRLFVGDGASPLNQSIAGSSKSARSNDRQHRAAGVQNKNVDLIEIAAKVDQSAIAFDQGWHRLASSRITAHQIPGIQPAVYPLTGVVEALRESLIARHDSGQASGFRW